MNAATDIFTYYVLLDWRASSGYFLVYGQMWFRLCVAKLQNGKGENMPPVPVCFDAQAVHNHNIPYSDFVCSPFKTDQTN